MIPRLKRQTKKRHSVQREGLITSRVTARRLAHAILADLSESPQWTVTGATRNRFDAHFTSDGRPVEPIIGARLTPDVWAP